MLVQVGAILATGNTAVIQASSKARAALNSLPADILARIVIVEQIDEAANLRGLLFEGEETDLLALTGRVAERKGPIIQIQSLTPARMVAGDDYDLARLLEECSISTNTAAAGGNASLMSL